MSLNNRILFRLVHEQEFPSSLFARSRSALIGVVFRYSDEFQPFSTPIPHAGGTQQVRDCPSWLQGLILPTELCQDRRSVSGCEDLILLKLSQHRQPVWTSRTSTRSTV